MRNLLLFFVFALFTTTSLAQQDQIPQITYNDTATIKLTADKVDETVNVRSLYWSTFSFSAYNFNELKITKPGTYYIQFAMSKPGSCYLGEQGFEVFLIPGDTVEVKLISKNTENNNPSNSFETTDAINNYLHAPRISSSHTLGGFLNPNKESITISEYVEASRSTDSLVRQNIKFLDNYASKLPNWFYKAEKCNIIYGNAIGLLQVYFKLNDQAKELVPFNAAELKNTRAILSEKYYDFILNYLTFKYPMRDIRLDGVLWNIKKFELEAQDIDSLLEGEMKDYFITCRLADLYLMSKKLEDVNKVDSLIKVKSQNLSANGLKFINIQRSKVLKKIKVELSKGDKAPGFYLKDVSGKQYNIDNFKGKAVYLRFWKTDCADCAKEVQDLKKLQTKISGKPAEIVNICLDNNPEKWKQIIEKEKLAGVNLISAGNWGEKLKGFYFIEELPHYALIDKNGLIVSNKCAGPADIFPEIRKVIESNQK